MIVLDLDDIIFLTVGLSILIVLIIILYKLIERERRMSELEKSRIDMKNLEKITENIERDYKPVNIKLTSYEQEQEDNAIISYEELKEATKKINAFDDEDFYYEKVSLGSKSGSSNPKIDVTLMSYEKEEAFLNALKQLQSELLR